MVLDLQLSLEDRAHGLPVDGRAGPEDAGVRVQGQESGVSPWEKPELEGAGVGG